MKLTAIFTAMMVFLALTGQVIAIEDDDERISISMIDEATIKLTKGSVHDIVFVCFAITGPKKEERDCYSFRTRDTNPAFPLTSVLNNRFVQTLEETYIENPSSILRLWFVTTEGFRSELLKISVESLLTKTN